MFGGTQRFTSQSIGKVTNRLESMINIKALASTLWLFKHSTLTTPKSILLIALQRNQKQSPKSTTKTFSPNYLWSRQYLLQSRYQAPRLQNQISCQCIQLPRKNDRSYDLARLASLINEQKIKFLFNGKVARVSNSTILFSCKTTIREQSIMVSTI